MLEQRFVRKDGEVVWGRLNVSLVRDERDAYKHRIIVCEDVTSLKTKESELQALGRIYEAMHSALQDIFKPSEQWMAAPRPGAGEPGRGAASYEEAVASRVLEIAREITGAAWTEYLSYDADSRMFCLTSSAGMPRSFFCRPGSSSGTAWMRRTGLPTWRPGSASRCTYRTCIPDPGG